MGPREKKRKKKREIFVDLRPLRLQTKKKNEKKGKKISRMNIKVSKVPH